jgi:formate dehydrogenase major subunit
MVNINIDGKQVEVQENITVLEAAKLAGVEIPTLCDHPALTPYGGCRLCLVEIEGARTLQPSCTLPVSNNMVVRTNTERTREARKFVLSLIFSERNHFCMYCQVSGGDCELQNAAYHEDMTHWPLSPNFQPFPVDASNPYFVLDHNRCILCRRCVRACSELVGNFTLGFEERGANSFLIADLGVPLGQSSCISCGTCVQVCPTGALIDRDSAYRGRVTQVDHNLTTCTGCSIGCTMDVMVRDNHVVRIDGDWNAPLNNGLLCKTGRFLPLDDTQNRILTPLVRKNGSLKASTWDEALSTVAQHLTSQATLNGNGVAALASTRLPAEALSLFKQLFVDQVHSKMVTSSEEGTFTAIPNAIAMEMGKPFEGKLETLKNADCIITLGADLIRNHEVASFFIKRNLGTNADLVTIDSQDNPLEPLAKKNLKPARGTETDLILGLAALLSQSGRAKGQTSMDLSKVTIEETCQKTGISIADLNAVADLLLNSHTPFFVYGNDLNDKVTGGTMKALVELAHVAVADGAAPALLGVKGQANSLLASLYNLDKPFQVNKDQMVYLAIGEDTLSQKLVKEVEKAAYLVVQASYASPLTAKADVIFPVEIWSEQAGHFINLEGRIQETIKVIQPADGIRSNADVLTGLAEKIGTELNSDWQSSIKNKISSAEIFA